MCQTRPLANSGYSQDPSDKFISRKRKGGRIIKKWNLPKKERPREGGNKLKQIQVQALCGSRFKHSKQLTGQSRRSTYWLDIRGYYIIMRWNWSCLEKLCFFFRETCAVCLDTQSCLTLRDLMDYNLPGSSVHGDSPGKNSGVGGHALLQGIFLTQGLNSGLQHWRWTLPSKPPRKPYRDIMKYLQMICMASEICFKITQ